jgi:hypothetical protein
MESSTVQSIHKGFEKEKWEATGNGCATSEDMFWKLDALQSFISDLHWPDQVLAEHLDHRLKLMAAGGFHDQGDAKWIVIRRSLWGHNDMPCGWPAPGRPIGRQGSGRPQGVIGVFNYY